MRKFRTFQVVFSSLKALNLKSNEPKRQDLLLCGVFSLGCTSLWCVFFIRFFKIAQTICVTILYRVRSMASSSKRPSPQSFHFSPLRPLQLSTGSPNVWRLDLAVWLETILPWKILPVIKYILVHGHEWGRLTTTQHQLSLFDVPTQGPTEMSLATRQNFDQSLDTCC